MKILCNDCQREATKARFFPVSRSRVIHRLYCDRCADKYPLLCEQERVGFFGACWIILKGIFS